MSYCLIHTYIHTYMNGNYSVSVQYTYEGEVDYHNYWDSCPFVRMEVKNNIWYTG